MKKMVSLFLALALLCTLLPQMALLSSADVLSGTCGAEGDGSNLTWTLDTETGVLTISGSGAMANGSPWSSYHTEIAELVLPDGLTSIGDGAFYDCSGLDGVTIPSSVTRIGREAFENCGFMFVRIPFGVTSIDYHTFYRCDRLEGVMIPASVTSIDDSAFDDTQLATVYGCAGSEAQTFAENNGLTFVPVPQVALIADEGGVEDGGFNQQVHEAAKAWCEANNAPYATYVFDDSYNTNQQDYGITVVEKAIRAGATVLLLPGFSFTEATAKTAAQHPDVTYILLDVDAYSLLDAMGTPEGEIPSNVYLATYREEQAGYLAGYAAVAMGYNKLGFLGGPEFPGIQRYGYGFVQGANDAAKALDRVNDVEVKYVYTGQFAPDNDMIAFVEGWYGDGVEAVFACGGGIYVAAAAAAASKDGKVIGVDADQKAQIDGQFGDGITITSAVKNMGATAVLQLDAILNGTFVGGREEQNGVVSANPDENPVGLAPSTVYTNSFTVDDYSALLAKIVSGELTISDDVSSKPAADIAVIYQCYTACDWDNPTYVWSDDNATCTATRVCKNDDSHVETETAQASYAVTTEPTCGVDGAGVYTAAFVNPAFETQTKNVTIDATGQHTFGAWTENTEDETYVGHYRECTVCHVRETGAHTWNDGEVTTQPTCAEAGVKTFTCTVCGATKTEDVDPTGQHTFGAWTENTEDETYVGHYRECTVCHIRETGAHTWNDGEETTPPTCAEAGVKTFTCTVCGATKTEDIDPTGQHTFGAWTENTEDETYVGHYRECTVCHIRETGAHTWNDGEETTPPTCAAEGVKTFTCTVCGATKTEDIDPTGQHTPGNPVRENEVAPTCTEKGGYDTVVYCTVCQQELSREHTDVDANGHTFGDWKENTENETYVGHYRECTVCHVRETGAHTWNDGEVTTQPTCAAVGVKTFTCTVCGATKTEDIDPTGQHTPGNPVRENEVAPTCTEKGGYDTVVYCTVCQQELSREHTDVDAIGHDWGEPTYAWGAGYNTCTATRVCKHNETHTETETVTSSVTTTPATCEEAGETVYVAEFVSEAFAPQTKVVVLDPTGHNWKAPTYEWSADNRTVTAMRECKNDANHIEMETVETTLEITTAPTCMDAGEGVYTATFENEAFAEQSKTAPVPALGHDWGEASYEWSADNKTVTATACCTRDGSHVRTELAEVKTWISKQPTYEKEGERSYIAWFLLEPFETQTKTEPIAKLPPPADPVNPFRDVKDGDWFKTAVLWAVSQTPPITNGVDATHFAPMNKCSRAEIVTFLWNAAGKPTIITGTVNPFVDVSTDDWYYASVIWAVSQGITNGTDPTHFAPTKKCSRAEVVTFLRNAAGKPEPASGVNPFRDISDSDWYYYSVLWAVGAGITNGTDATHFSPTKACTRAEVVQFLYNATPHEPVVAVTEPEPAPEPPETPVEVTENVDETMWLLERINQDRVANGLEPLTFSQKCCNCAAIRAQELSENYALDRPDGRSWLTVFDDLGYKRPSYAGQMVNRRGVIGWSVQVNYKMMAASSTYESTAMREEFRYAAVCFYRSGNLVYTAIIFSSNP